MILLPDADPHRPVGNAPATGLPGNKSHGLRCAGCGYNLTGLTENRCPECGLAFDPEDPLFFASLRPSASRLLVVSMVCQCILVLAVSPGLRVLQSTHWFYGSVLLPVVCALLVMALAAAVGIVLVAVSIAATALWVWAVGKSVALLCQPAYLVRGRWAAWVVLAEAVAAAGLMARALI